MLFNSFRKHAWLWLIICVVSVLFASQNIYAQFGDLAHDEKFVELGLVADNAQQQFDATSIIPLHHGWIGVNLSQAYESSELDQQVIVAHIQDGLRWEKLGNLGIEVFADGEWNSTKGTNTHAVGGFIRPGILSIGDLAVSGGLGSFVENEAVRAELGLEETDPIVLNRYLGFVSARYTGIPNSTVTALLKTTPAYDFRDWQASVELTSIFEITDGIALLQTVLFEKDSDPVVGISGNQFQAKFGLRVQL